VPQLLHDDTFRRLCNADEISSLPNTNPVFCSSRRRARHCPALSQTTYDGFCSTVIAKIANAGCAEFSWHLRLNSSSGWVEIDQSKI
jgi:hypothetical protein